MKKQHDNQGVMIEIAIKALKDRKGKIKGKDEKDDKDDKKQSE